MQLQYDVNDVVLSNVTSTGEFKIKNSAKAFSILSSGLYSNKIKAIVRELSCNAIDSHVAANKADVPFEVHLPSQLEPWFSVKDFGIGLDYEGVTHIYTTYFESTKTDSNAYIGALGLGSKSPFSYTDNFSITAIKNGKQCIFSAFINEIGIPSVALMSESDTDECNGVEVKFSVTETHDFYKFREEAKEIFSWFSLHPTINDGTYTSTEQKYKELDIIPGVHLRERNRTSVAVMGNIAYPINKIPNSGQLGPLVKLLNCGIVINFNIGEVEFAASREELSFVPSTIAAIENKLKLLQEKLAVYIEEKVKVIDNDWERAFELKRLSNEDLFQASVFHYIKVNKIPLVINEFSSLSTVPFIIDEDAVTNDYSMTVSQYYVSYHGVKFSSVAHRYDSKFGNVPVVKIEVRPDTMFVLNDIKKLTKLRVKSHFANHATYKRIVILSSSVKDATARDTLYNDFLETLHFPPNTMLASELNVPVVAPGDKKDSAMVLKGSIRNNQYGDIGAVAGVKWEDVDRLPMTSDEFVYIPMCAFTPLEKVNDMFMPFDLNDYLERISVTYLPSVRNLKIYGIRKRKLKEVEKLPNWKLITEFYKDEINKTPVKDIEVMVVNEMFSNNASSVYTNDAIKKYVNIGSPYLELMKLREQSKKLDSDRCKNTMVLFQKHCTTVNVEEIRTNVKEKLNKIKDLYPMLGYLGYISEVSESAIQIAKYINMVDDSLK